jgi:hypothetical protein
MSITAEDVATYAEATGWDDVAALVRSLERIRVAAESGEAMVIYEALDAHRKEFGS